MATKKAKTKKPSGLTMARSGNTFTCTWKIGDKDYSDGQQFQYRINGGAWTNIGSSANIGKTATSQVLTLNPALYYPTKSTVVKSITYRVRGNRKTYTKKGKKKKPGWSDWVEKSFTIAAPRVPSISGTLDGTYNNKTTFSWSVVSNTDDSYPYVRVEYQTGRVKDNGGLSYGSSTTSTATSGSIPITEDNSVINDGHSYRRYVRIRAVGMGGASAWRTTYHTYATPKKASNLTASGTVRTNSVDVVAKFNTSSTVTNPIDQITAQYLMTTPGAGLTVPSGASFTDGPTVSYKDGSDTVRIPVDSALATDNVIFVRVNTIHDRNTAQSNPVIAAYGSLTPPTSPSATFGTSSTITVSATNNCSVPGSFLAVYYHDKKRTKNAYVAGIIPNGSSSVNITVPSYTSSTTVSVGVQAVVGNYTSSPRGDGSSAYTLSAYSGKKLMTSSTVWAVVIPIPANVAVASTERDGVARVTWSWNSSVVSGVEIAWADHNDAWESTEEPETYRVAILYSPAWNISGLETGKTWYFRLRFYMEDGNSTEYSPWTVIKSLDLTSAPETPDLVLSSDAILVGETFDASWIYVSTDGTRQNYAEVREVTVSNGSITSYGKIIGKTTTSQRITFNTKTLKWTAGQTKYLALKVVSRSGRTSEWSQYETIQIVEPVTCEITEASIVSESTEVRSYMALKDMPMTVTVAGAGNTKVTSVVIERADSYHIDRPDEGEYEGYEGEAVYVHSQTGDSQITINNEDLIGRLDDGAPYRIVATVSDQYGQKATATQDFEVHWTHQALVPLATASVDEENYVAMITPVAPDGATETDRCDIYRLSADKPELIYPDAEFGETYVDPYPAFNEHSGHRVVFKTANNDYITAENQLAWFDLDEDENDYLETKNGIIDFDGDQIEFQYNLDVSHSWSKDFTETQYLGGSVQGDWNPAISRSGTIGSVAIRLTDGELLEKVRRLASYPGICKVRTPDGTCISATVQVSESWKHDRGQQVAEYSLSYTRVDPQEYEGMTLDDYLNGLAGTRRYALDTDLHVIESVEDEPQGGRTFTVNNDGNLIMTVQDNAVENVDFSLKDGRLVVSYGD